MKNAQEVEFSYEELIHKILNKFGFDIVRIGKFDDNLAKHLITVLQQEHRLHIRCGRQVGTIRIVLKRSAIRATLFLLGPSAPFSTC